MAMIVGAVVIRRDFEETFHSDVLARFKGALPVELAFQELSDVPNGFRVPAVREDRPWGTGHAVWSARKAVCEPFCVINADDYYGRDSFNVMADFLRGAGHSG